MPTAPRYNGEGELVGEADLKTEVFGRPISTQLLHLAVLRELANRRQGTHDTKTRSEVRGGGRKPYRQKGTGRARQGSTRAPHWRHGGIVHGPEPRDHDRDMPRKMRRAALLQALSSKAADGSIVVVADWQLEKVSTRNFVHALNRLERTGKKMLVVAEAPDALKLSARNIPGVSLRILPGLSTYEVIATDTLILTEAALELLQKDAAE